MSARKPGGSAQTGGPVLEDDVLRLRPLTLDEVVSWQAGEDDEIRRWFQLSRPSSRQDVTRAIQAWKRSWTEGGPVRHFGIWTIDGDALVGGVEVRDRGEGSAYLTYLVFADHRRRGHASRAVRLAADYARRALPVERLVIITDAGNEAARGVAEAAGFGLDGPADPSEYVELGEMLRYVRT
ncbi:MAG: GNAT family N-acetyltransferase [Myxococcales bacterium]|nr:GNAT family N-acetyltransferase [Myxococcales bacterium]